ncbi:MAG: HD domain-containing protein [Solirubrobacteraceae bacterium]
MATLQPRAHVGTLAWAKAKDGELSRREQIGQIAAAARVLLHGAPAQVRQRLGLSNRSAFAFDPDALPVPDSSIAGEAEDLCRESSSKMLLNHCFRSYVWGMILGTRDGLRPDPEFLYVASMLHDLALTDRFREYASMPCFGARAGIIATDWAQERGWEAPRCATLADAISLHLNASVPARHGPEAQLLQAGAGLDVIGLRHWELAPETVAWVLERYPRHSLKSTAYRLFEAEAHPCTRSHLLHRWLMFGSLVRHSQFDE